MLTDATHGEMRHFAVVTVQVRAGDGTEGLGYTYTVGKTGGSAVLALIRDDLAPTLPGADPRRVERVWNEMWWRLHYVGRGGVTPWLKVAHLAEAHNLPVTTHGVHDLHVHLLASVPNASFLEAHGFGLEAYIREPLQIVDGYAIAPDRPGHGVELDWDELEPHRVGI